MRRGTTPTLRVRVDCDLTGCELHLVLRGRRHQVERREPEMAVACDPDVGASLLTLRLTQAETLAFDEGETVGVQLRAKRPDGAAMASDVVTVRVRGVLEEGEI